MEQKVDERLQKAAEEYGKKQGTELRPFATKFFITGALYAQKDLALTIEDIERIHTFLYAIKHNKQGVFTFTRLSDEQYQEVLKRFKNLKK